MAAGPPGTARCRRHTPGRGAAGGHPRDDYTLAPGDRLFPGEGPALTWADWPGFVPAAVEGAALVQYVLPMRLRGKPHHVEAGAWWNGSGTGVRSLTR